MTAQAPRDENRVPALLGSLNTDGVTTVAVLVDPSNHALKVNNGATGSDFGTSVAPRDQNRVPVLLAVSSTDGVTPVPVYANSSGQLMVQST